MKGDSSHSHYRSIKKTANKLLQAKWDSSTFAEHRRKVNSAKPEIDTTPPREYIHLHVKPKKLQQQEEYIARVGKDNATLLTHMKDIMKGNGIVDHVNHYHPKSLNREKRIREIRRVDGENKDILKRLNNVGPVYDTAVWDQEWRENRKFMDNISCYSKDWWKKKSKEPKSKDQSQDGEDSEPEDNQDEDDSQIGANESENTGENDLNDSENENKDDINETGNATKDDVNDTENETKDDTLQENNEEK